MRPTESRWSRLGVLLLLFVLTPGRAAEAPPVGQLINVSGAVRVKQGQAAPKPATLLTPLHVGDLITVPAGGAAEAVFFKGGKRFGMAGDSTGKVTEAALVAVKGAAPRALPPLALNLPGVRAGSRTLGAVVRAEGDDPQLGPSRPAPAGGIRDFPVTLHWSGPVEGTSLEVRVKNGAEETVRKAEVPATAREYRLPAETLKRGETYTWTVTAISADGTRGKSCGAGLRVLREEERTALEALERSTDAAAKAEPENPAPVLLRARAYEELGLRDEALDAYRRVLQLHPEDEGLRAAVKRLSGG